MNNWDLYMLAHIPANKDVLSNWLTPEQFELELKAKNILLLRDRLGLPERYKPGTMQAGASASRTIESDLIPFFMESPQTLTAGVTNITDWYHINSFYTADSVFPEIISVQEYADRRNHPTKTPNAKYPVGLLDVKGLKIFPATITNATVLYYRNPAEPSFVTTVNDDGELIYDAENSEELEWSNINKIAILHLILQDLGVNIEKQDLQQLAQKLTETGK